jgi:uncharacterized protein YndB with AHSA1/START domain
MSDKIEAKVTHRFAAPPEAVYDLFLDPARVPAWQRAWLAEAGLPADITASELDPKVGGAYRFADRRDGEVAESRGTFLALERPTKIEFTLVVDPSEEDDPPIVTLIIEPEPDGPGSIVTLYNTMDAQWADYLPQTEKAWLALLNGLDRTLGA